MGSGDLGDRVAKPAGDQTPQRLSRPSGEGTRTYHRFGQYSRALDQIRLLLEHRAVEQAELERMCSELRIPGDFDVAQINWRP